MAARKECKVLNILLVEDDDFFRQAMQEELTDQGHKVTSAHDGLKAREIILASRVSIAVVSDIQMPNLNGIELLAWVKANKPMPFILMTGFAMIMETKKAIDLGADDFLTKPFDASELKEIIERASARRKLADAHEYCKVSLEEFVSAKALTCDVFVKLGSRYVRIGRRGDSIPRERIQSYGDKGLKFLYVRKDDFRALVDFNLSLAKTVANSPKVDNGKKSMFLRYTGEVLLEKVFVTGVDEVAFADRRNF